MVVSRRVRGGVRWAHRSAMIASGPSSAEGTSRISHFGASASAGTASDGSSQIVSSPNAGTFAPASTSARSSTLRSSRTLPGHR